MLALWQRETRGIGAWIDASIQASMALHEHVAFNYSAEGRVMKRAGSQHQHNAPANLVPMQERLDCALRHPNALAAIAQSLG